MNTYLNKKLAFLFACLFSFSTASVSTAITESQFNAMFPKRSTGSCASDGANTTYTYANLIAAASMFPDFANTGTLEDQKREIAAFLGQTAHETTGGGGAWCGGVTDPNSGCFDWGFCYTEEVGCNDGTCTNYNDNGNSNYPVVAGHSYHGRGAIQLSWNYNYGPAGEQMKGDKTYLLNNPDIVKTSDWAFRTAIWYWMDATSSRPSPHAIITGSASGDSRGNTYGGVTNSINGGIECGAGNIGNISKQHDRVNFFKNFASDLGVSAKPSSFTGTDDAYFYCSTQLLFGSSPWTGQDVPTTIILEGSSSIAQSSSLLASSSSSPLSSSSLQSSSSTGATCQRTLVNNYTFNISNASNAFSGFQQNNYNTQGGPFSQGDIVVPEGQDCSLALTLDTPSDVWNLYTTSNWTGNNQNNIRLEKIVWIANSSSSQTTSSIQQISSSIPISSSSQIILSSLALSSSTPLSSNLTLSSSQTISSSLELSSSTPLSSSLPLSSSQTISSSLTPSSSTPLSSSLSLSSISQSSSSSNADLDCSLYPAWQNQSYNWSETKEFVTYQNKVYSHINWASNTPPDLNASWILEGNCLIPQNNSSSNLSSTPQSSSSNALSSSIPISSSTMLSSALANSSSSISLSSVQFSSSLQDLSSIQVSSSILSSSVFTSSQTNSSTDISSSSSSEQTTFINFKSKISYTYHSLLVPENTKGTVSVFDIAGQVVSQFQLYPNQSQYLWSLKPGMYFVKVQTSQIKTFSLFIQE